MLTVLCRSCVAKSAADCVSCVMLLETGCGLRGRIRVVFISYVVACKEKVN